jgi:hypothetical protein
MGDCSNQIFDLSNLWPDKALARPSAVHMPEQPVQKQEDQNRRETTAAELIRTEARDETAHWTLHENTSPSEITPTRRALSRLVSLC